jgi:hypothetical protein
MIHYLVKDKGLKLEAAQEQVKRNRTGVTRRFEVVERLQGIRHQLSLLLDAINTRR